jgi:hypothetical protein
VLSAVGGGAELFFLIVGGLIDLSLAVEEFDQTFEGLGCSRARHTYASVVRCDSRLLLQYSAPTPNHGGQSSQGLVDRVAIREDVKHIPSDDNDVRAFGIARRGPAASCPGEVILRAHRIALTSSVSMVSFHTSFSLFWLLALPR